MIDLAGMRSVRVNPVRRTARAEGGTTWGERESSRRSHPSTDPYEGVYAAARPCNGKELLSVSGVP